MKASEILRTIDARRKAIEDEARESRIAREKQWQRNLDETIRKWVQTDEALLENGCCRVEFPHLIMRDNVEFKGFVYTYCRKHSDTDLIIPTEFKNEDRMDQRARTFTVGIVSLQIRRQQQRQKPPVVPRSLCILCRRQRDLCQCRPFILPPSSSSSGRGGRF